MKKYRDWITRLRLRLGEWFMRVGARLRTPKTQPNRYPDYVTCPHCGEPEVEVWGDQPNATCHQCGQTFNYTPPADCASE
ncbi:MAG: hypothetical protein AAB571_07045 [Chloroflexota bacterium]